MTILANPPYGRGGLHKRIFREMCKHGTVYSLQPHGSCKTHEGYTAILFPLHTSVKMFNIALMTLEVCTNDKNKSIIDLSKCKFVTVADGQLNGTVPLEHSAFKTCGGRKTTLGLRNCQQPEPLKVRSFSVGNGLPLGQPEILRMSGFKAGDGRENSCSNGLPVKQLKGANTKNCIWFNSKKERTNFIKNISKIIALQLLFFSGLFPTEKERLLPPLDREYSKDELLDYFNFPKDVYKEFDDIEKEEPNSHYTSFEKWRDYRKEKYGLDFEEE